MKMMKQERGISPLVTILVVIIVVLLAVSGYAFLYPSTAPATTVTSTVTGPTVTSTAATTTTTPSVVWKMAEIIPGYANDQNYGQEGYNALMAVKAFGAQVAYTENILSPTATFQTAVQQYIQGGYNIIYLHGSQFASAVGTLPNSTGLASQNPKVEFIVEEDNAQPHAAAPNVWVINRNFQTGFYALGVLAALTTKTGTIGYVTGSQLPFTNAEVNAVIQGMNTVKPGINFYRIWTGDFTDPVKSSTATHTLMGEGADVILSGQNLGDSGVLAAALGTSTLVAIKYTDMHTLAPANYLTSYLYNFTAPIVYIFDQIRAGTLSGYYSIPFSPTGGAYLQLPITNVNSTVQSRVQNVLAQLSSGAITVPFNATNPGTGP